MSTATITKEQEAHIISLIETGGYLTANDLQYVEVFRAIGFVITRGSYTLHLTGVSKTQRDILTKYRTTALYQKMLTNGHEVSLDVISALERLPIGMVLPLVYQLGVIFSNEPILKHFLNTPTFMEEWSMEDYEDWTQHTLSVAVVFLFNNDIKAKNLKLLEKIVHSVYDSLGGIIGTVKYHKPKKYIRYNRPKLRLGNLCILEIIDNSSDILKEAEWVLKQHLRLEDCKFPYLLCSRKKKEQNEPTSIVVLEKYTNAREALVECKKHSGRMIVVINFKRHKLGWYEVHDEIVSNKFVYINSEDRFTTFRGDVQQ